MSSLWLPKVHDIHQLLSNLVDFNCIYFNVILSSFTEILSIWHTVSLCSVFMEKFVFVCRWLFFFLFAIARTRKSLPTPVDYWLTETWWHRISLNWIQEIKPSVCSCDLDTRVYAHCCNLYTVSELLTLSNTSCLRDPDLAVGCLRGARQLWGIGSKGNQKGLGHT